MVGWTEQGVEKHLDEVLFIPIIFYKRVIKCIKDHRCFACGETILTGSSYFISIETDPTTGFFIKICEDCFDKRLEIPAPIPTEKELDRKVYVDIK
jgi:hypothetical protein